MLPRGVVSDVLFRFADRIRERCIGSVPGAQTPHLRTESPHTRGLFPSRSFIDQYICSRAGERSQQLFFERVGDALFRVVANAEADRNVGSYWRWPRLIQGFAFSTLKASATHRRVNWTSVASLSPP